MKVIFSAIHFSFLILELESSVITFEDVVLLGSTLFGIKWDCGGNFETIIGVSDVIHEEFGLRIIPQLDPAAVAAITRFLLRRNLMMTGSLSPVGSRLLVPLVRSVMRMEAEAELRSAVLLDLGRHAAELCRSQHGVAVIKSLDGFI